MNDADLGENITQHADRAENQLPREYRFQNDEAHLYPSRWWFASSAFPMIAGTLGPVASAFSICALARPWRQQLQPGADVAKAGFIPDPSWLITVNAIQLAVAVVANAFLLLNMARRVRFSIAQPVTIVGWYTSSILLIGLCGTAAGPLLQDLPFPERECIWSQAFWYGIWAAVLYFVNASLMSVTFWGSWTERYGKDFILTTSQRTLMLQTVVYLFYLLIGALVFSNIEGWNYLDAVYWSNVTLFTIGFGDFSPQTDLGAALVIPYALIGVISLGLVIASIRSLLLERGRKRVDARMEEKKRRQTVRSMTQRGRDSVLEPIKEERERSESIPSASQESGPPTTEYDRRKAEFDLMRKIQDQAGNRRRWVAMATSAGTWLILWLVGAAIFQQFELPYQQWSYFTAFYFCFVSFTTIGYGNDVPISPGGKSFFVFWSLLALPTMTVLISNAGDTVVKFVRDATIRLGNITILPGEDSFMGEIMHIISRLSGGVLFKDHLRLSKKDSHQQFVAHIEELENEQSSLEAPEQQQESDRRGRGQFLDVERPPERATSTFTSHVRRSLSRLRDPLDELPQGTELHFLLISEIQVVGRHLREAKPRKYSFEEWAWYLKLIGEDERDATNHRKPRAKNKRNKHHHHDHEHNGKMHHQPSHDEQDVRHDHVAEIRSEDGEELRWSWVGNRSPLMGSQEESEWILDRLTNRLRESLSAERRRQMNRKPRGASRLAHRAGMGVRSDSLHGAGLSEKTRDGKEG